MHSINDIIGIVRRRLQPLNDGKNYSAMICVFDPRTIQQASLRSAGMHKWSLDRLVNWIAQETASTVLVLDHKIEFRKELDWHAVK